MLSYTVLYFTLVAVCVCRVTHTASNGQDEKCERLHCIFVQRNDANTIFNCSISTWAPVSGKLCVQPDRRLENPQCTHVVVDESGITANISEDKYTFIKIPERVYCSRNMAVMLNISCNEKYYGLVYINLKAPSIQLTTTTTENHHLHLQCNGTGLHQDTKLRLYGPEQEYQCLRLTEDTGSHVVCQHTIASPNQTHSGHYYCQVDPSTCDALKSENVYVHVQTSVTVSINDITTDDTISYVSTRTVSNDDVIVSTSTETRYKIITIAVAGIGSTFLVLIASFILGCYLRTRQEMKANRNNERGQQRPANDRREQDDRGINDGEQVPDEQRPDQEQLLNNDEDIEQQPGHQLQESHSPCTKDLVTNNNKTANEGLTSKPDGCSLKYGAANTHQTTPPDYHNEKNIATKHEDEDKGRKIIKINNKDY